MKRRVTLFRKWHDLLISICAFLSALAGALLLGWIIYVVVSSGAKSLGWVFFTEPTKPYGIPDGGIANAILGTVIISVFSSFMAVPLGLLGGIYLSEFGLSTKITKIIRFSANVMMGIPSIIVGLFVYSLIVVPTGNFSGFAGSVALAIIMFPIVVRTAEDTLCMVPDALREASLALGAPRWRTTMAIVFRSAKNGLLTGILLAVARVSGETAPLLFTALWSDSWPKNFFTQPTANLTVTINEYATNSPFASMHSRAWGGALLISVAILALNILCRIVFRGDKNAAG